MATKNFQSITLYKDMAPQVLELTREEAGDIYQAIFRYSCYGKDTDFTEKDRFVRSLWETTKLKLQAGEAHDKEISETNRKNAKKRWEKEKSHATECNRKQPNATECNRTTITDTVTETISSTITNSFTGTNTEQVDTDLDAVAPSSSFVADANETKAHDLFSLEKLQTIVANNKIKITTEGLEAFFEEMQDSGWILYSEPIEKRFIARAIRGWLQHNEQYLREESEKKSSSIKIAIIKKASEYVPQTLIHECSERGEIWVKHIPEYCPKDIFTDEELALFEEKYGVSLEDW